MEWLQIILGFLGGGGLTVVLGFFTIKSTIRKARIDADKSADERYRQQIDHQQQTIDKLIEQVDSFAQRLSKQNDTIDRHIDRHRELSDRLYKSEQELNRKNEENAVLIRHNERLQRFTDFLKQWHCRRPYADCRRRKPEQRVKAKYEPPEGIEALLAASETDVAEFEKVAETAETSNETESE